MPATDFSIQFPSCKHLRKLFFQIHIKYLDYLPILFSIPFGINISHLYTVYTVHYAIISFYSRRKECVKNSRGCQFSYLNLLNPLWIVVIIQYVVTVGEAFAYLLPEVNVTCVCVVCSHWAHIAHIWFHKDLEFHSIHIWNVRVARLWK